MPSPLFPLIQGRSGGLGVTERGVAVGAPSPLLLEPKAQRWQLRATQATSPPPTEAAR